MPFYEYSCKKCANIFEIFTLRPILSEQDIADCAKGKKCPSCASTELERLLSTSATILKSSDSSSSCEARGCPLSSSPCAMAGMCPSSR